MFLGFLLFSILVWFINRFSSQYTAEITTQAKIQELPNDRMIDEGLFFELPMTITTHGFRMLSLQFYEKRVVLNGAKLKSSDGRDYLVLSGQLADLKRQFPASVDIVDIATDTLFIETTYTVEKRVPLRAQLDTEFRQGYGYVGALMLSEDSITITGPKEKLDTIQNVFTKNLRLEDVFQDIEEEVEITSFSDATVRLNKKRVVVSAKVDRYVQESVEVPIQVLNLPRNQEIRLFPNTATIRYTVGQKDQPKLDKTQFEVVCYYQQGQQYLEATLRNAPPQVRDVRINEEKIDYLIKQ